MKKVLMFIPHVITYTILIVITLPYWIYAAFIGIPFGDTIFKAIYKDIRGK